MAAMDLLDDLVLGPLDLINRIEGIITGIRFRDAGYRVAVKRIDKGGRHTGREIEKLLRAYGIPVYGRTHDSQHLRFLVKRRQARWAEYLLLHAGVQVVSPTFDHRNPGYAASHSPGWMPTPWSERPRGRPALDPAKSIPPQPPASPLRRLLDWLDD